MSSFCHIEADCGHLPATFMSCLLVSSRGRPWPCLGERCRWCVWSRGFRFVNFPGRRGLRPRFSEEEMGWERLTWRPPLSQWNLDWDLAFNTFSFLFFQGVSVPLLPFPLFLCFLLLLLDMTLPQSTLTEGQFYARHDVKALPPQTFPNPHELRTATNSFYAWRKPRLLLAKSKH